MTCSGCGADKIFARGYCQACYWRLRRRGTVVRKNASNTGLCSSSEGCHEPAIARGLCSKHYQRTQHPLAMTWRILRSRSRGQHPPEWETFDGFVAAVGERPSPHHQLRRVDCDRPWAADNFVWREPLQDSNHERIKRKQAAYTQAWNFRKKYKISVARYNEILAAQGGVCAICKRPETMRNRRTGKIREMCVDHDHKTGAVRGVLCSACNVGASNFNEDPALLRAAIAYLESHSKP